MSWATGPAADLVVDLTDALSAALSNGLFADHRPDGAALTSHRLVHHDQNLWLIPRYAPGPSAVSTRLPALVRDVALSASHPADPVLYWLAHTARQRAWRALARLPGPGPVVRVARVNAAQCRLAVGFIGHPGRAVPAGIVARLDRAFDDHALRQDAAWANRHAGHPARRP
ncbi:MAG: hypothetical protein AAF899_06505 [Pseudomonadota bacterium]